jgi:hypothetical protein
MQTLQWVEIIPLFDVAHKIANLGGLSNAGGEARPL